MAAKFKHRAGIIAAGKLAVGMILAGCSSSDPSPVAKTSSAHSGYVCSIAISKDGGTVYSGGEDGKLKFWNAHSLESTKSIDAHTGWVQSIAISPNGMTLVSAGRDDLIKIWDAVSGKLLKSFESKQEFVKFVTFNSSGTQLVTVGRGPHIRMWNLEPELKAIEFPDDSFFTVSAAVFTQDDKGLVLGADDLKLCDPVSRKTTRVFRGHTDSIGSVAISRNGKLLASAGAYEDKSVRLWDLQTGVCLWVAGNSESGTDSVAFAANDTLVVGGDGKGLITFWEVTSGNKRGSISAHTERISSIAVDPTGTKVVSGSWDKSIKINSVP
jgi:WD40 repeat protein